MNERIKELAIQAGFFYEDYKDIWYLEYHNQSCEEEMKKFAELIVRECMLKCENVARSYRSMADSDHVTPACRQMYEDTCLGAKNCIAEISDDFGVKQ